MKGLLGRLITRTNLRSCRLLTKPYVENGSLSTSRRFLYALSSNTPHAFSDFTSIKPSKIPFSCPPLWSHFGGQKRTMFIQTQSTPNPLSLMFYPGKPVVEAGSADFPNARSAMNSPLAKALFGIDGITRVFFGSDFITVTKSEEASWDFLKPEIFAAIMDFFSSGNPVFLDSSTAASMDTAIHEDDSEIVAMIKELLETRIRPAVQDDGGDIVYRGFDPDTGVVKLKMQGACSGCPSSSVTLKSGIENMLMHYVPEVKSVEQELDEDEQPALTGAAHE
ncbi:nifU-like protein 4, mitochondrial [Solanum verrucosum]|uniref:nifU-like protein 4, mitochondrial n=1 Tax=Solanum verrucosum TaxID=315347 RepID=UPI0020D05F33|nr:nifU-like protein 4, mitochondrial [Solanum verrucosum]